MRLFCALLLIACAASAQAAIQTREMPYRAQTARMVGYFAYDDSKPGIRPGVIVVHEWWGLNDYAKRRARDLAELGYSALAIDMYGEGKHTEHPQDAMAFMQAATRDADAAKARFLAGLELLKRQPQTDPSQIAAIGYCFGGKIVLDMARQGLPLAGVASFHGALGTATPASKGSVKARSWWSTAVPTAWSRPGPRRPETGTERRRRRLPGGYPGRRQTRLHQPRRRRAQGPRPGHRLRPPGRPALLGRPAGVPQGHLRAGLNPAPTHKKQSPEGLPS